MTRWVPLINSKNDGGVKDITLTHFYTNLTFIQTTIQLNE